MDTSSIFADFSIKDKKTAEAFVKALEQSAKDVGRETAPPDSVHITDKDEILKFFAKRKKKDE